MTTTMKKAIQSGCQSSHEDSGQRWVRRGRRTAENGEEIGEDLAEVFSASDGSDGCLVSMCSILRRRRGTRCRWQT